MLGDPIRVEGEGGHSLRVVVGHPAAVLRVRSRAPLAEEDLPHQVVVLSVGGHRESEPTEAIAAPVRQSTGCLDELIPRPRGAPEAGLGQQVRVVEEGQGAHRRRQRPVLAIQLGRTHHGRELGLDLLRREGALGQRLQVARPDVQGQPSVEEVDHVRAAPGRHRGCDPLVVGLVGERLVHDLDVRVFGLELPDQLVDGGHLGGVLVLPVGDGDLPGRGRAHHARHCQGDAQRQAYEPKQAMPQHGTHAPSLTGRRPASLSQAGRLTMLATMRYAPGTWWSSW